MSQIPAYTQGWSSLQSSTFFGRHADEWPKLKTSAVIGISVAIAGNVLISLALNLQKLAHSRVEMKKMDRLRERMKGKGTGQSGQDEDANSHAQTSIDETEEDLEGGHADDSEDFFSRPSEETLMTASFLAQESVPLLQGHGTRRYDAEPTNLRPILKKSKRQFLLRILPFRSSSKHSQRSPTPSPQNENGSTDDFTHVVLPVDVVSEEPSPIAAPQIKNPQDSIEKTGQEEGNESDYLKSKLWWLGFLLMNIGETGNFISYAFAPASVVAPLGTFALIANCLFAPLLLGEKFHKLDLLGIVIAIIGAITVVLSSNSSDARLGPDALMKAISQISFIIYSCIYAAGALSLAALSEGKMGRQWVFVDVGLCAIFGGFTVLSTKAFSTLIAIEKFGIFTTWIMYPILFVLVLTGISQIRYLNRALMRFDSKVVIPVQFVLFNLSAIVGSAILFGDFKRATFHQLVTFFYGCAATFAGVFIIAWAPVGDDHDEQADEMDNNGLPDQNADGVEDSRLMGGVGRRRPATLVLPNNPREMPILRSKRSSVSLIGLSPAQHLLLVHSPPREISDMLRARETDIERSPATSSPSPRRRRAISWFGDDPHTGAREGFTPTPARIRGNTVKGGSKAGSLVESHGRRRF